jgi:hypothetical protein
MQKPSAGDVPAPKPEAPDDRDIRRLVGRLWSPRKAVRETAAAELAELGPDAINAVYRRFRLADDRWAWQVGPLSLVCGCAYTLMRVTGVPESTLLGPVFLVLNAVGWLRFNRAMSAWGGLAHATAKVRSPDLIEVLLEVAGFRGGPGDGGDALAEALALADTERLGHLDNRCMANVRALMANTRDRRLVLALLDLCARVGDSRELGAVRGLCRKGTVVYSPCSVDAEVNEAAERARAAIEVRLAATPQARRLVRPASAPADGSAVLLRPAHGVPTSDEDRLLRPVGAESADVAAATDAAEAELEQRGGA